MSLNDRSVIFRYMLWACSAWTLLVGGSLYWNYHHEHESTLALARNEAVANINKDLTFRRWATGHGGVYVPLTEDTPSNPYLVAGDKDVETTGGHKLTLMNPAYMVRQMQRLYSETFGIKGHITSLLPLNPSNKADPWETSVLQAFDAGERANVFATANIDGAPYVRAMMPMITEPGCLKCHAHQGYQVGDVRGGISVSVPLAPYLVREHEVLQALRISHLAIWAVGVLAFYWLYRRALMRLAEREQVELRIRELNESLDRRVRQRTAELEKANSELESFSYSVSHDLRAPLRALNGYARIIQEDEAPRLSQAGKEMLARIWVNAERMGALIDDILQFSRVGRTEMSFAPTDMSALAAGVVEELRAEYPAAAVRLDRMPAARGDEAMLRQVWINLIGNALKFSSRRERPEVQVGSEVVDGVTVYFVRDNGAGFDMTNAGHLFGVFQRLHAANDYPGTGAGLAIVKRIVERHGGRIWAESAPDKGATFRFTLEGESAADATN